MCHNGIISTKIVTSGQARIINEYNYLKHKQLFIFFLKNCNGYPENKSGNAVLQLQYSLISFVTALSNTNTQNKEAAKRKY